MNDLNYISDESIKAWREAIKPYHKTKNRVIRQDGKPDKIEVFRGVSMADYELMCIKLAKVHYRTLKGKKNKDKFLEKSNLQDFVSNTIAPIVFGGTITFLDMQADDDDNPTTKIHFSNRIRKEIYNAIYSAICADPDIEYGTIPHRPDVVKFLTACKHLFPNVYAENVFATANAMRNFVQNIHSTFDDNAPYLQKAPWLMSDTTGGIGKTFIQEKMVQLLDEEYHIAMDTSNLCGDYVNPKPYLGQLTIISDTDDINTPFKQKMINNIMDHGQMEYNIKYGDTGHFYPKSILFFTSNYKPSDNNIRRYDVIRYYTRSLDNYTKEEQQKYFPLYHNNDPIKKEEYNQWIRDLLECVPYDFDANYFTSDDKNYFANHRWVYTLIADGVTTLSSHNKIKIHNFIYDNPAFANFPSNEKAKYVNQIKGAFAEFAKDCKKIFSIGKSPIKDTRFDFREIYDNLKPYFEETEDESFFKSSGLDETEANWDALIARYTTEEEPTPPSDPEDPTTNPEPTQPKPTNKPTEKPNKITTKTQLNDFVKTYDLSYCKDVTSKNLTQSYDNDSYLITAQSSDNTRDNITPTAFCFESDDMGLNEQLDNLKKDCEKNVASITFSGSKSYHFLVSIPKNLREKVKSVDEYKALYWAVAHKIFKNTSHLDPRCATRGRLTRCPLTLRANKNKVQENIFCNFEAEFPLSENEIKKELDKIELKKMECNLERFAIIKNDFRYDNDFESQLNHIKKSQEKFPSEAKSIAIDVLENNICLKGANYIGCVKLLKSNYPELLKPFLQIVKAHHPTNLPRKIEDYLR